MTYPIAYLEFADSSGLDFPGFNTLRLGRAWSKRLKVGERVFLAHKQFIVGSAHIVEIQVGPKLDILFAHARFNHVEMALRGPLGDEWTPEGAVHRRLESMRKNYGQRSFDSTASATVIYLRRLG